MTIRGLKIEIGADATKFNQAMSDINKNSRSLNSELGNINRSLKFDTKNPDLLAQKTKVLSERFNETSKKLDLLKSSQDKVTQAFKDGKIDESEYRKHQTEIMKTESQLKGYEEQLKKANAEMLKYDGTLGKLTASLEDNGKKMQDVGKKMAPYSAAASGALFGLGKAAMTFDTAWVGVQKTMNDDITPEQLERIKTGIKDMSKEIGVGTTEIAGIAESAGQLGIETDNILEFTRVMVDMGQATNLSSDVAATTLAKFANVTKMSQSDFSRLGSTIVALGNNFATTEADIAAMAMNLGAAGSQVGMSHSDIVALSTALSSVGIEAQSGGTSFSKVMVEMQLAAETGSDKLQEFADVAGVSADQFAEKFKTNATGALQDFIVGLSKSEEAGSSAIKVLDDMGITETRLRDSLLRSANASEIFTGAIDMGSKAWEENNALQDEAQQRYDSVEGKMKVMKETFNVMAINLGDKLLPHLSKFFEWVTGVADKFGALDDSTQKFIVTALGIVAVGAPLLILGGKVVSGLGAITGAVGAAGKAMGLIKVSGGVASTAFASVGTVSATAATSTGLIGGAVTAAGGALTKAAAIATGPWGLAIAGVVAGGLLFKKNMDKDVVPSVDLFADSLDRTSVHIDEFGNETGAVMVRISEETKTAVGSYMELSDGVQESFTRMYIGVDEITEEGMTKLKGQTDEMVQSILDKNTERKNQELTIMSELFDGSTTMTEQQKEDINTIIAEDYQTRENKTIELRDELKTLQDEMFNNVEGGTQKQKERVEEILTELNESAVTIMTKDEAERNVILNRMNDYGERLTTEHASTIIQELDEQKNKTIGIAGDTRDEQVRIAEDMKVRGGTAAEETAQKIIDEANRQYKETVELAEKGKTDAVDKLIEANEDLSKSVDTESGKIKTGWDKLGTWWDNLWFKPKKAVVDTVNTGNSQGYGPNYNNGLTNVPYNGYQAILHRDEAVLTAYENRKYKRDGYLGNPTLDRANKAVSNVDNSTVNNNIQIGGTFHIREESDIKKVARELLNLQNRKQRA